MAELVDALDSGSSGSLSCGSSNLPSSKWRLIMNLMTGIIATGVILVFISFFKLFQICRLNNVKLRGIIKINYFGNIPETVQNVLKRFIQILLFVSMTIWIILTSLTLKSDYSFLSGIYPLVIYYFLIRYFLWEKSDLIEQKK